MPSDQVSQELEKVVRRRIGRWRDSVAFLGVVGWELVRELWHIRKIRRRELFYYFDLCGRQSLGIVLLICGLMGVVLGIQAAIQMQKFGTELFIADLVGFSIVKELGPLMVAMIATGRAGSAFAAEIGTMKVDEEISALETMGLSPARFLVVPKLLAMLMAMPLLTVFGDAAGLLGGMLVGVSYAGIPAAAYWNRTIEVLSPLTFTLGLLKCFVFGTLITLAGCRRGFEADNNALGVGRAATDAVVSSILLVVVADMVITVLYSLFGY